MIDSPNFMVDIECTGVDRETDDILQIAAVALHWQYNETAGCELYYPGAQFVSFHHTDKEPTSEFAQEHMLWLYDLCRKLPKSTANIAAYREKLLKFFAENGGHPPDIFLMGWNLSNFDLQFLEERGALQRSKYIQKDGKDVRIGDTHYRTNEMAGSLALLQEAYPNLERDTLVDHARSLDPVIKEADMPKGKEHDGLWDCYDQIKIKNGCIRIARNPELL